MDGEGELSKIKEIDTPTRDPVKLAPAPSTARAQQRRPASITYETSMFTFTKS